MSVGLPPPEPLWLVLLASLFGMVLPAAAAITAVVLLGPPNVPHTSRIAVLAAGALTLAEAIFAGLGAGALLEAAWRGVRLPGSGPVDYLPLRAARRRRARENLVAISEGTGPVHTAHRGRASHVSALCLEVGRRLGLSNVECDQARIAALAYRDAREISPVATATGLGGVGAAGPSKSLGAVVETYDALIFGSVDDPGFARDEAFAELRAMHFDPDVVEALIEVETEKGPLGGRFAAVPLLGGLLALFSELLRRGRYFARTSATPAAGGATVVAIIGAGLFGFLPALQGGVLTLRTSGPSVVVEATPTPTDSTVPTGGPSAQPNSSTPSSTLPVGTGNAALRAPLYFPSQVPHRVVTIPLPGASASTFTSRPVAGQSPVVIYVTQFPTAPATDSPTPTPSPTNTTPPPAPVAPVADKVVSADLPGAHPALTSPSLSTSSGNELILAFVSADGPATGAQSIASVTGGGLTWSLAARESAQLGTAEVWQAYSTSPLTNATVVATLGGSGYGGSITVATFTGAASAVGHTAAAGGSMGLPPAVPITTTKAGSMVWAVGHDGTSASAHMPIAGQSIVHEFLDTAAGHGSWVQATGQVASANSVVTAGDSSPILDRWDLAAVEVPSAQ